MDFDTIVIGAGAAGMMCAAQAPGHCLVIEHAKAAGEKIRISGGGRCNFTNLYTSPENFISRNPHFVKSALARYSQWDFIDWVAQSGIAYHEKTLGQLFCDISAKEIISMLKIAIDNAGGKILLNTSVQNVEAIQHGYRLNLNSLGCQTTLTTYNLVVACGGKPIPKMGATDFGLRLARQFGLNITETYAGLVPFTFSGQQQEDFKEISGIAVPAKVSTTKAIFNEAILFTHRGISGPASLQASSYWKSGQNISISLLDKVKLETILKLAKDSEGRKSPYGILTRLLPTRLVPKLIKDLELPERIADLNTTQLAKLYMRLSDWQLMPSGTEGYRTAEVMVGGVDTDGLLSNTMMAKNQKSLYFIGECVDVTGWLGGYNFQWAWSSGWVAGQSIRSSLQGLSRS
jgi:hypothetical protein